MIESRRPFSPCKPPLDVLWRLGLSGTIRYVTVNEGWLLIGHGARGWSVFDARSGNPLWEDSKSLSVGASSWGEVLTGGYEVLIEDASYDIYYLNKLTGVKEKHDISPQGFFNGKLVCLHRGAKNDKTCLLVDGKLTSFTPGLGHFPPMRYQCADPYWIYTDNEDQARPMGTPGLKCEVAAVDPASGTKVWKRSYNGSNPTVITFGNYVSLTFEMTGTRRNFMEVLDMGTGASLWTFVDPDNLTDQSYISYILIIQPEMGIAVIFLAEVYGHRAHAVDLLKNRRLWTIPDKAWACFCTGDVLWLREPAVKQGKKKPEYEQDLVARSLRTGKELWRVNGLDNVIPYDGRLYSWRGKTLTCWAPVKEVEKAKALKAKDKAASKAAPAKTAPAKKKAKKGDDKVVLRVGGYDLTGPEDEGSWRELMFHAMDESDNQRVPVGVLLEGLRAKFAEVNLLPGGRVEIYDRKEQFWGSIQIDKEYLPKGTRKITEETQINAFDVHGDFALAEVLGAILHKRKLAWDCAA